VTGFFIPRDFPGRSKELDFNGSSVVDDAWTRAYSNANSHRATPERERKRERRSVEEEEGERGQ